MNVLPRHEVLDGVLWDGDGMAMRG